MGTEISLKVGGVTVDWSKNMRGADYGPIFQEEDRKRLICDQIDYGYFEKEKQSTADYEMAFSRSLRAVLPRLEMLGFRLEAVRQAYEAAAFQWHQYRIAFTETLQDNGVTGEYISDPMSFDEYLEFIKAHPIGSLSNEVFTDIDEVSNRKIRGRFDGNQELARIPSDSQGTSWAYSERTFFGAVIGFLDPYLTLRLLAECPANLDMTVDWQYGPLVESGWAIADEFCPCARRTHAFLIATEGSSDIHILNHAIKLLRPEVADFFRFIDVSERHPFSGTGSLVKFAEGLAKIDVQNKTVILFDNDAEGVEALMAVRRFKLPPNMSTLVLPDLQELRQFPAKGPDGIRSSDINGRAAAIECYLDLNLSQYGPAKVVWTNYKKDSDVYHGVLEYKDFYAKEFLAQTLESIRESHYDISKIEQVLDTLIDECCKLAMAEFIFT